MIFCPPFLLSSRINMLYCDVKDAFNNKFDSDIYLQNDINKVNNCSESLNMNYNELDTSENYKGTTISALKKNNLKTGKANKKNNYEFNEKFKSSDNSNKKTNYESDDSKPISDSFYSMLKKSKKVKFTNHDDYVRQFMNDILGDTLDSSMTMDSVYSHIKKCNHCKKKIRLLKENKNTSDKDANENNKYQSQILTQQNNLTIPINDNSKNKCYEVEPFTNNLENINKNIIDKQFPIEKDIIIIIMIGIVTILILDVFTRLKKST